VIAIKLTARPWRGPPSKRGKRGGRGGKGALGPFFSKAMSSSPAVEGKERRKKGRGVLCLAASKGPSARHPSKGRGNKAPNQPFSLPSARPEGSSPSRAGEKEEPGRSLDRNAAWETGSLQAGYW